MAYDPDLKCWREEKGWLKDFVGLDWKTATDEQVVAVGKTLDMKERGMTFPECECLVKALNYCKEKNDEPLTILETGMGWATSTRVFIAWIWKNGGKHNVIEVCNRVELHKILEEYGYWKDINFIHGSSFKVEWDKPIDFLFIDSAHDTKTCFGEYEKFSKFLTKDAVVGFHDTNYPQVITALNKIKEIDKLNLICEVANKSQIGIQFYERG